MRIDRKATNIPLALAKGTMAERFEKANEQFQTAELVINEVKNIWKRINSQDSSLITGNV